MEQNRQALGEKEINAIIDEIKKNGWTDVNLLNLVRKDLEFGLTREEVDIYLNEKFKPSQMRKLSLALRKHGVDFAKSIAKEELDDQCMQVAIDYYDKGVSLKEIANGTIQIQSAHALKEIYEGIVRGIKETEKNETLQGATVNQDYVEKLLVDMKEIVIGINRNAERYEAMSEKLKELEIDSRVKEELKEKDACIQKQQEEIEKLNSTIAELREKLTGKEEEMKEMKNAVQTQIPVQYVATIPGAKNGQTITAVLDRGQTNHQGLYAMIGKLAFKKKSKQDIIKLVASGELSKEQLAKIKVAMEKGLTEEQLLSLIHGNVSPEQMEEIIEIAVLENSMK